MKIDIGTRWLLWSKVRVVTERSTEPRYGLPGPWLLAVPEDNLGANGKPTGKVHWTWWIEEGRCEKFGTPIAEGERVVVEQPTDAVEAAATAARKKKVMTPERRLANRITSTRYRIKHPEKSGRSEWSPTELAEMKATIDEAVAELAALKEAK